MSIWIGKQIEVPYILPEEKTMGIIIHMYCNTNEILTPKSKAEIDKLARIGCQYLVTEGFLPSNIVGWTTTISAQYNKLGE